ncbi:uncharacterized protein KNAG_0G03660 [Huiozyma naganishii CBS 8797]|uniref:Dicers-like N-terminal domain-containing protein n=1 Tax=Huiozyma naganishii (strain ATCC MYA-139 / BCRC 22969 / CBS 8797 / KCTC 17520 / NBRC 10181 / NCYC 3082 / Yp74L-3) TaxID=1071383 RepID=J7RP39_HUIN7|nr:hypothetical protein KNAG_0G03660 [Kazachstania naganishii CBS 8797]CCK71423.1 hypothetical protein KNAG_0G03660 [Kazachstania naganishii CBS 8797]
MSPTDQKIKDFCKLQYACQQLNDSMKVIYELGMDRDVLQEMANGSNKAEQAIAMSPAMAVASYMKSVQPSLDISQVFKHYQFDADSTPVDEYITLAHIAPQPEKFVEKPSNQTKGSFNNVQSRKSKKLGSNNASRQSSRSSSISGNLDSLSGRTSTNSKSSNGYDSARGHRTNHTGSKRTGSFAMNSFAPNKSAPSKQF